MSTWLAVTLDERDVGVALGEERVGEGHARRAGPHDEVVGLVHRHTFFFPASSRGRLGSDRSAASQVSGGRDGGAVGGQHDAPAA